MEKDNAMEMEKDNVLEYVVDNIKYTFKKDILVKPLEAIMLTTEYTEQIPTGEKDEEGYNKYETKTSTKEVESDLAKGIVIALPTDVTNDVEIGDTIVYARKFAKNFDLLNDSQLVKPYDVIAVEKKKEIISDVEITELNSD